VTFISVKMCHCADQTYVAQLPQWPQVWQLLKSTLRNSNEFVYGQFQQLVNQLVAGCKFLAFFHFVVIDAPSNSSTAAIIVYPVACVPYTRTHFFPS